MKIVKNGLYQHYKGNNYLLLDVVRHSETLVEMVLYKCLYENDLGELWVRPLEMFIEEVVIDGVSRPRFAYIGDQKGKERL